MTETRSGYSTTGADKDETSPLADLVDAAVRKIVTSLVIAGAIVGLAIYMRPSPPRYQMTVADGRIYRLNGESGTIIACEDRHCAIVVEHGQDLDDSLPPRPPAPQALPAPGPQPSAAPAATPAPAPAAH